MAEITKVFRVVKWNPIDYAYVCKAASKDQRNVSEFIRIAALNAARKTNENEQ